MKKYLKQFGFVVLLFVMIVGVSGCGEKEMFELGLKYGEGQINDKIKKKVIEVDENGYWVEYEKPDGWETITNKEYNVSIDVPKDWVETSILADRFRVLVGGLFVLQAYSPDERVQVGFALVNITENYKKIKPSLGYLSDNEEMIKKGGNAFKYFRGAYSQDIGVKNDDLIVFHDSLTKDITWDNFIDVGSIEHPKSRDGVQDWLTKEEVETIKTIIKSFRKL